jgi:hypothetical protein
VARVVRSPDGLCGGLLVLGRGLTSCHARGHGTLRAVMAREACWRAQVMSTGGRMAGDCLGSGSCSG